MLGVTYKTAWFLTMRICEAMGHNNRSALGIEDVERANNAIKAASASG